jgi:phenylpropionate dioxygenase-like ring-hydroxylating dioxygenase large terminal subunit
MAAMTAVQQPTTSATSATAPAGQPGPSIQQLLDAERRPVPAPLRAVSQRPIPLDTVSSDRYWSQAWHDAEVQHVWRQVWQVACRVEDIPNPGDHAVYDIADDSILVVRTEHGEITAFHNVCLHRGTKLKVDDGHANVLRCPFHGFTWNLDGTIRVIPSQWDFEHVTADDMTLPEVHVGVWGGFVFVSMADEPQPFHEYLEVLTDHFATPGWELEHRVATFHAAKVIGCNWKVAAEAFIESYHVIATHPQILQSNGDANTQYDVWGKHVNRMVNAFAVPSPHLKQVNEQQVADNALALFARLAPDGVTVEDGHTAREAVGGVIRERMGAATGIDFTDTSDAELLDAIEYFLFPNFAPWAGVTQALCYRWRPNGNDPNSCIMDVWRLAPLPPDVATDPERRPAAAQAQHLTLAQSWKEAKGMGLLADIFEQDMANLPRVQAGLRAARRPVTFAQYQESRIRHLHETLERRLGLR